MGLRNARLGFRQVEQTHLMENIIYNELRIRGYHVDVGVVEHYEAAGEGKRRRKQLEVDFVAMDGKQTPYYQVAASVRDEKPLARELASLEKIPDHYPKIVLTLDEDPQADYNGIRRINALDWLMGTVK